MPQTDFISYPFEWSFEQLKDAALLILDTQRQALVCGLTLASASAFQIQFRGRGPVFNGGAAMENHIGGRWAASAEFVNHFLTPLLEKSTFAPMARRLPFADALPLKLLRRTIATLQPRAKPAVQREDRCSGDGFKRIVVNEMLNHRRPRLVYDLGVHNGEYARLAVACGAVCESFDPDPACVDARYRQERSAGGGRHLPLVLDTALGPAARPEADFVIALALCHHLLLAGRTPLSRQAAFLRRLGRAVLVEFVPASGYALKDFLSAFRPFFDLRRIIEIPATDRRLCLFEAP